MTELDNPMSALLERVQNVTTKITTGGNTRTGVVVDVVQDDDHNTIFVFEDGGTFCVPFGHAFNLVTMKA